MDTKRFRTQISPPKHSDLANDCSSQVAGRKSTGLNTMKLMGILVVCLMIFPVLVSIIYRDMKSDRVRGFAEARDFLLITEEGTYFQVISLIFCLSSFIIYYVFLSFSPPPITKKTISNKLVPKSGSEDIISDQTVEETQDKLLGGLLVDEFDDEESCLSRYQSILYRKTLPHRPSSYLVSRLRRYEALHKRCGAYTKSYNRTLEQLKSGHITGPTDCKYVVWISFSGLGNRILALASAFLYALLTNRVLLVDRGNDMTDLFCEPFPGVSWLLPLEFPLNDQFNSFNQGHPHCYGNMVLNNSTGSVPPPFVYLHLAHDYNDHDKLFFCDQDQSHLQNVPWLVIKTDNYFVPSLFLIPSFDKELSNLFPDKETVFHHLGRYLFHPTNSVWGLISRYYQAYLAKADVRVGIQIRVFDTGTGPFQYVIDQILACSLKEKVLPEVDVHKPIITGPLGK
uniref:Fucosyltransferase n=1 Tax=Nelumbo nucifera TaxID=4432 RepID=A0A822YGQ8_NELNU|nr:TPA_asm: hypothetical protein HUJ06_010174 [Nelumbo nucifera]